jgi:hypothetical protein
MGTFFKVLRCSAADFKILSAARFSAAGVLALAALQRCASPLQRSAAVLKNTSAAAVQECAPKSVEIA